DCLVAVCCQRLEFLRAARLHVPRCEILLPTSGARGTIRSGNFSQIATVLQAGGEEGMWTFDRYQRWMEQVTDWVRPPQAAGLRAQGGGGAPPIGPPLWAACRRPPGASPKPTRRAGAPPPRPTNAPAPGASRSAPGRSGPGE